MEKKIGVCNLCEAICGIEITLEGGRVTGIRGNPDDPLSRGHICPKGVALGDVHDDPDRLRRPLVATGDGASGRRSAGTRRSTWSPTGSPRPSTARRATRSGVYLGNPNVHSLGFATHGIRAGEVAAHPQPVQRHHASTRSRTSSSPSCSTATSC